MSKPVHHVPARKSDIETALTKTGYPLEIRLATAFDAAGMDPLVGWRLRMLGSGDSRDIDLLPVLAAAIPYEHDDGGSLVTRIARLSMHAVVQAKSLDPAAAFVGFRWKQPDTHTRRVGRSVVGGSPSFGLLGGNHEVQDHFIGPDSLYETLDPLDEGAPVCVQWATVRPGKSPPDLFASHDDMYWGAIETAVVGTESFLHARSQGISENVVLLSYAYPTLIIATEKLRIFDATQNEIVDEVDWLVLEQVFNIAGRIVPRRVDVVTEAGVPAMIARYKKAFAALRRRVEQKASDLRAAAIEQRDQIVSESIRRSGAR